MNALLRNPTMVLSKNGPLSDDQIRRVAPGVFALHAHESRSDRYRYIPTIEVLAGLRKQGFEVYGVSQGRSRELTRTGYAKHMLRLRHRDHALVRGDAINEIALINSHDGSSQYRMLGGVFRVLCANGLVVSESIVEDVTVKHSGPEVVGEVIEGAFRMIEGFERIDASRQAMEALQLSSGEQNAFARAALTVRFPEDERPLRHMAHASVPADAPVTVEQALRARRHDDTKSDLWTVFNRVQENLVGGGVAIRDRHPTTGRPRTRHTRAVQGIDGNVNLNRALWVLADELRKAKG